MKLTLFGRKRPLLLYAAIRRQLKQVNQFTNGHAQFPFSSAKPMPFKIVVLVLFTAAVASSQEIATFESGAVGVDQALRQLKTTASVLHVVAHPDDEDGAMMTYCARGLGTRTMLFSVTRGEGGANMISNHFFDELGALRTLEHVKAAQFYGTELFYSRAVDYGYSKTLEEARRQWDDGLPILEDLVEVIRREQPTIMLSRFQGQDRDGHGHHQMAGVISRLAFDAAADPKRFPEQLARGLQPWQVKKLYMNNIRPQWRPEDRDAWNIAIPTGDFDSVIGKSYSQIARFGLGFQRSQGITGHAADPEPRDSYYRLLRVAANPNELNDTTLKESSLFDGIDTTLSGAIGSEGKNDNLLADKLRSIQSHIDSAISDFDFRNPISVIAPLSKALAETNDALDIVPVGTSLRGILNRKASTLSIAIRRAAGVDVQCYVTTRSGEVPEFVVPGLNLTVHVRIANQGSLPFSLRKLVAAPSAWAKAGPKIDVPIVEPKSVIETSFAARVPIDAAATRPAFQRSSIREPFYKASAEYQQRAIPACPLQLTTELEVNGQRIAVTCDAHVRIRHPDFGNVRYPLTVAPPIGVRFLLTDGILPTNNKHYDVDVSLVSAAESAKGDMSLQLPDGWTAEPANHSFVFARAGEAATIRFRITPKTKTVSGEYSIRAVARHRNKEYSSGYRTVTARDIGRMNVFRDAVHRLRIVNVKVAKTPNGLPRVAYVSGSGDSVAESLGMLNITPTLLSASDLATRNLDDFDVILVGVRAYAVRADLRTHNQRLLDFVERGGTMIVQYQTPEFDNNFGPFPYTMGRNPEEVSEEDAAVTILEPNHSVFMRPNRIISADFDNWVEQRGSKFFTTWDDRYTPLLECHDTNQDPQRGGMLIANHGKGVYVYSAYAWYRQLPNGVPGAFRLFANLLSLPAPSR